MIFAGPIITDKSGSCTSLPLILNGGTIRASNHIHFQTCPTLAHPQHAEESTTISSYWPSTIFNHTKTKFQPHPHLLSTTSTPKPTPRPTYS